jgi:hypothetical protein
MVAPRREEQRARIVPHGYIKAKRVAKEVGCDGKVSYMEVDVSDHRAGRHTGPFRSSGGSFQAAYVQRIGTHHQLTADATPCAARTIRVHLDPQIVGIL